MSEQRSDVWASGDAYEPYVGRWSRLVARDVLDWLRVPPGKRGRYGIGGSMLATRTGTQILPIAHNAGEFWGRYAFKKRSGVVKVVIGAPIMTEGRDVLAVHREVEEWIEGQMRVISPEHHADT